MKKKILLTLLAVLGIFTITACNKENSINNNLENIKYEEIIESAKEIDLLFKDDNIGIKNINQYLETEKNNKFSKLYNEYYSDISYDSLNEFQKHLIETYAYFCVMSGYSGRNINEIYGYTEDNTFIGDFYVYGYDIPNSYNEFNITSSQKERIITIVAPSYDYSKIIYFYYEVKATKNNDGKIKYTYSSLSWDLDGINNSLHYSKYKKVYASDYILDFNNKNKKFSKLLYDYGYQILGGGAEEIKNYKDSIRTIINTKY